jgi:hypothetical protein
VASTVYEDTNKRVQERVFDLPQEGSSAAEGIVSKRLGGLSPVTADGCTSLIGQKGPPNVASAADECEPLAHLDVPIGGPIRFEMDQTK